MISIRNALNVSLMFFSWAVMCLGTPSTGAVGISSAEEQAHAKGIVIMRATVPSTPCPNYTTLKVRDTPGAAVEGSARLTINGRYFASGTESNDSCTMLVAGFAGPNQYHEIGFAFSQPGDYEVEWDFGSTGTTPVDFSIKQKVQVAPATSSDLEFLDGLGRPDLMRAMYGDDIFERNAEYAAEELADPEARALKVIARLLSATRERDPTGIKPPKGDVLHAADILAALAKEIPESSYAPYAAYYAGCCYFRVLAEKMEMMMKQDGIKYPGSTEAEVKRIVGFISGQGEYARAKESLEMAISHADAYLKPLAIYMKGCLVMFTTNWEEAEELLDVAVSEAGGTGTIHDMVENARRDIQHARAKYAQRKGELGQSSTP